MRADRDKRAIILTAEGQRTASITTAEGQKQAAVLSAEGQKQAAILSAEGDRQSAILRAQGDRAARYLQAQGQAKAIEKVFAAVKNGKPTPELLAYQYLQTLPQLAQGDANKVWMIPSGFDKALEGFAKMLGEKGDDGVFRYEPSPVEEKTAPAGAIDDDVKDWFTGDSSADLAEMDRQRAAEAAEQAAEMIQAAQLNAAAPLNLPQLTHDTPRNPNIQQIPPAPRGQQNQPPRHQQPPNQPPQGPPTGGFQPPPPYPSAYPGGPGQPQTGGFQQPYQPPYDPRQGGSAG
jgi:regulator of protease activity HflC (stomatin/prohibitin superfamily)